MYTEMIDYIKLKISHNELMEVLNRKKTFLFVRIIISGEIIR